MFKRIMAAAAVLLALSACASPKYVTSDVTRFHTMSSPTSGQTFAIIAASPEQEQSIAFKQYGDLINARLSALGLKQFSGNTPTSADYVVTLDYEVLGPTPDVRTQGGGNFSFGFGYSNWSRPFSYGIGYDSFFDNFNYTETRQLFARRIQVNMYRGASYVSGPKSRVFEVRAVSLGLNSQIEVVMPYMLDAVFQDFPGQSGRTRTVSVQVPTDVERNDYRTTRPSARSSY
jgi:Domain of unknown function (DUF4136)